MKRLIIYYNFILVTIMVVAGFFAAQSPASLLSAVIFFPLAAYMWFLVLPQKSSSFEEAPPEVLIKSTPKKTKKLVKKTELPLVLEQIDQNDQEEGVIDSDRRKFIRLISSAGLGVFVLTMFTNKAEATFFGSAPGPGTMKLKDSSGVQIDPAEKEPTDGYGISQIDDDASPAYYGYVDKNGKWYIVQDASGGYRYAKGASSFSTNWTNRAGLTYDYFDAVF